MPSKKSKKKKKPLTEEEKVKQAEMKGLAEKEKLVRRRRLTNAFLKLKKDKEYELLKVNDNKLLDLWRPRLRKLKCDEIMEEYKMLQAAFERNYRKKDELIGDLENSMKQNDEEYDNAFDMHLHNIDKLLEFYHKRLNQVREMYAEQKKNLLRIINGEVFRMDDFQEKSLKYLKQVIISVNERYQELGSDSRDELFIRREEIKNKAMEDTHAIKVNTDAKMKAVWDEIQALLLDYDAKISPLRKEFVELRKIDDVVVAIIDSQFKKSLKMQVGIDNFAKTDKSYCATLQNLLNDLYAKRDDLKANYRLQQQRFESSMKYGRDNIRNLALVSGMALESLTLMTTQRERLMNCIERCRKRERLDEKIDPFMSRWGLQDLWMKKEDHDETGSIYTAVASSTQFGEFNFMPKKMEHLVNCDCNPCTCAVDAEMGTGPIFSTIKSVHEYSLLERFWTRFNRVTLELRGLNLRRTSMTRDHSQLRLALRNYMGGMNPLQHNPDTFAEELMANEKRNYNIFVRCTLREWKRRERSRKVGGIRMH